MNVGEKIRGSILGLAVGDALGVPVEFTSRAERKARPVTGLEGYGAHCVPSGTWSDDTSLTLALMDSLRKGYNTGDMMCKFLAWWEQGEYTATGEVFDIGRTTELALRRFRSGTPAERCGGTEERDNGNGALMRILPQVLYELCASTDMEEGEHLQRIYEVAALTHGHKRSQLACGIYYFIMKKLLSGAETLERRVAGGLREAREFYKGKREWSLELRHFERIFALESFARLSEQEIRSGGYVIDTLEAAVWCLLQTSNYKGCVLTAVNLGDDTDTVAAVAGSMAGLWYGENEIPGEWLAGMIRCGWLKQFCRDFAADILQK